jgi:small multidrug resistance pump|tara:strand:+ start:3732 stop:4061 length:330 start_codon:yes stop_codon:yes gene_type:complete
MPAYLLLFFAIVSEVAATTALKASDGFTRPLPVLVVVVGYALAFWLLAATLKQLPLGLTYAVWAGLGIVGSAVLSYFLFSESFGVMKMAGMTLILAGVVIANLSPSGVP